MPWRKNQTPGCFRSSAVVWSRNLEKCMIMNGQGGKSIGEEHFLYFPEQRAGLLFSSKKHTLRRITGWGRCRRGTPFQVRAAHTPLCVQTVARESEWWEWINIRCRLGLGSSYDSLARCVESLTWWKCQKPRRVLKTKTKDGLKAYNWCWEWWLHRNWPR